MANNTARVGEVAKATDEVVATARPVSSAVLPARSLRAHLRRLPEATAVRAEAPLIETDTAPGFSAMRRIDVRRGAIAGMSVDPRDGLVYVTNHADDSVAVLDPKALTVVTTIAGVNEPFAVAVRDGRAFVSTVTLSHDAVAVLEPGVAAEPVADHPVALSVRDLVIDPTGRCVYLARTGRDGADLAVLDTADGSVTRLDLGTRSGASAEALAISRDGSRVYVITVDDLGGELVAVDTVARRVIGGLAFPAPLRDLAVSPDGATLYLATCDLSFGGVIDVVDTRRMRVVDSIEIGGLITQVLVGAGGDRLYVANGNQVVVICTATAEVIDTVTVVERPACIAESADGKRLFIADYDGAVTMLTVASTTESLLAKMMASDVVDVPMLELEQAGV